MDSILLYRRAIRLNLYPCTKTEYRTDKRFDVKRGGGIIGKVELPGGKYRLLSVLGRGATSVVYLAEKTGSGKRYAVKVSICDREKLRREAFLLQKFSYPGIPCAVELLESGTKSFLVMEAVNGKSIGQRMRKGERFSSREILKTGIALSGILCYLHAQNPPVFHRDLKPDNVMITERGEIYLVDFGAAGTEETGVEVRYGTRGYAAPEQYDGKCDARSDLYALGALLAAMAKHAKKRQKRGLWRVLEKCMQKKPEERYASAGEVKKALRRLERKQKGRKTLRIFAVFAFLTGGAAAVASRMPWGQFPAADEWEEQGDLWFCGNPVEEGSLPNYRKAREAFLKADHLSQAGRVEQELVEYCLADDAAREKMQMEPLLAEFYDDTQQEPEKEKRCRRYLAVAGMYFSFSEELARENDTDAMRKGIEVLEKAAGENMEGQWEAVIWQRLADACYLGGKSGDGEREQDWCQESFLYYERLLCSRQDGNRRKNLLRAAELALQFDMQEKAEQYLNEAAEIPGMEEDIFYQQIRKRWEEAG
ncbi:serine/threonine protein kinase [Fusicatenibacter sp.]